MQDAIGRGALRQPWDASWDILHRRLQTLADHVRQHLPEAEWWADWFEYASGTPAFLVESSLRRTSKSEGEDVSIDVACSEGKAGWTCGATVFGIDGLAIESPVYTVERSGLVEHDNAGLVAVMIEIAQWLEDVTPRICEVLWAPPDPTFANLADNIRQQLASPLREAARTLAARYPQMPVRYFEHARRYENGYFSMDVQCGPVDNGRRGPSAALSIQLLGLTDRTTAQVLRAAVELSAGGADGTVVDRVWPDCVALTNERLDELRRSLDRLVAALDQTIREHLIASSGDET